MRERASVPVGVTVFLVEVVVTLGSCSSAFWGSSSCPPSELGLLDEEEEGCREEKCLLDLTAVIFLRYFFFFQTVSNHSGLLRVQEEVGNGVLLPRSKEPKNRAKTYILVTPLSSPPFSLFLFYLVCCKNAIFSPAICCRVREVQKVSHTARGRKGELETSASRRCICHNVGIPLEWLYLSLVIRSSTFI